MINLILNFSVRQRMLVILGVLTLTGFGLLAAAAAQHLIAAVGCKLMFGRVGCTTITRHANS